ncbi:MAG: type III-A CRISPR-associated protein Csm2 [bacterium]
MKGNNNQPRINDSDITAIIVNKDTVKLNDIANKLGEYYASGRDREKLSTAQIRNILDRIQRMHKYDKDEIQLLRPLLAYAAGKDTTPGKKLRHLQQILEKAILKVNSENTFNNLRNFFEAIVAYHRYYGGK